MKLLQNSKLESISAALCVHASDCTLNGRCDCTVHVTYSGILVTKNECDCLVEILTCLDIIVEHLSFRVESYSCKMAGNDKRLYKLITNDGTELQALSPPQTYIGSPVSGTPTVGPNAMPVVFVRSTSTSSGAYHSDQPQFCNTINKKILFHLISTLNTAFHPDYDFTDAKSDEFSREPSLNWTMSSVKSNLSAALGDSYSSFEQQLWSAIEEEIQLKECEIYRSV